MTFRRYIAEDLTAARGAYPNHWIVEVVTSGAACLIAIADTPENRDRAIPLMPGMTADLLDGASVKTGQLFHPLPGGAA